jgi:hypothetical protein
MIDPAGRSHHLLSTESVVSVGSGRQASQSQSFAAELSDKLASTMTRAAQSAGLASTQPAGQQGVTWRNAVDTSTSTQPSGLSGLVIKYPTPTPASGTPASGTTGSASTETLSQASYDASYWAEQPAAVQVLQHIQDPTQRAAMATELAQEGYSIDVPIMDWGWDPQITTQLRQADGYTWVPSAEQPPVEVAPGLTFAGASYNPAQPPTGSILVL